MRLQQDYRAASSGMSSEKFPARQYPDDAVIVGNHRDAWVYRRRRSQQRHRRHAGSRSRHRRAAAKGWRPKRTLIFCSWDAEEEGLLGSTEWAEEQADMLAHAVAYFNVDVGVSGPNFDAAAVPSLKAFVATSPAPFPVRWRQVFRCLARQSGTRGLRKATISTAWTMAKFSEEDPHGRSWLRLRLHAVSAARRRSLHRHRLRRPLRRLSLRL